MDVFHVGASAPKAPESKHVERDEKQPKAGAPASAAAASDAFASSSDAAAVARYVKKVPTTPEIREDVIKGVSALLDSGAFDKPEAARRAAQGILDS
jgi:hypothetical protein